MVKAKARVTVRTNLTASSAAPPKRQLLPGGGRHRHDDWLSGQLQRCVGKPGSNIQTVLDKALDSNTAFEILSIDIADVDVGENVGAKLQAEQAEANKLIAQAHAEVRRAAAVALEQEMSPVFRKCAPAWSRPKPDSYGDGGGVPPGQSWRDGFYKLKNVQAVRACAKALLAAATHRRVRNSRAPNHGFIRCKRTYCSGKFVGELAVFAAFILLSSLANWLKRRRGGKTDAWPTKTDVPAPRRPAQRPRPGHRPPAVPQPAKRFDWEQELRRLLGEEEPPRPETAAPPPLPPVVKRTPKPAPAPSAFPRIPPVLEKIDVEATPNLEQATRVFPLTRMAESQRDFQKASQMSAQVAERMHQVDEHVSHHALKSRTMVSSQTAELVRVLRQPRTARQAFVTSLVFGPPKALDSAGLTPGP